MSNKKIAIEISGYLRKFYDCVGSWENLLLQNDDNYRFDFFVHTYEYHGYSSGFVQKEINEDEFVDIPRIKKIINPIEIITEKNTPKSEWSSVHDSNYSHRVKLMYRKIKYCHDTVLEYEKLNNFKYDYYIRIRPDLIIGNKIIIPEIELGTGIFNKYSWGREIVEHRLCDQFFICDSVSMNVCSNLFLDWDSHIDKHPETILYNQITNNNIKICYQDFNINILR